MRTTIVLALLTFSFVQNPIDKNYLLGRFDPSKDSRFVQLTSESARGSALNKFLRKESLEAFKKMQKAAKADSVNLFIVSATRNFDYQKRIWEDKWSGKIKVEEKDLSTVHDLNERTRMILLYSAMPATSRHHWGTDIDINEAEDEYFETLEGKRVYQWLVSHAAEFGFCQPYTSKIAGRTGYEEEKWHWSYLPLSGEFLRAYKSQIQYSDITGFSGSEIAKSLQVIENYVDGVACR
jgi:LAS superfamily LD-carboxypeptidase LdcB